MEKKTSDSLLKFFVAVARKATGPTIPMFKLELLASQVTPAQTPFPSHSSTKNNRYGFQRLKGKHHG